METLQRIIVEETQKYVATLNVGDDDYLQMEEDLMKRIKVRITQTNQVRNQGDARLSMPKYLSFGQIADILNKTMIIRIITDGDNDTDLLGVYNGEIYDTNLDIIQRAAIQLNNNMTKHDLEELVTRLYLTCEKVEINKNRDLIAVGNGIFDYKKKVLLPFDEKYVFLSKSEVPFNPHIQLKTFADGWNIEDWLRDIAIDDEVYGLLWETIGSVLRPYVKWNKSIWLYSTTGNNGKGTFCELLRNLLGPKAFTSIPISDFSKDFALGPLIGKQAIITDENDVGAYIDKVGIMKAVVTGDIITINKKYEQPINYRFQGMMIQCLNEYPRIKDRSDSFYRRQIFIPFDKSFTGRENKNIKSVYLRDEDVLEYAMNKVLMSDYYELSEPAVCREALQEYKGANDPIRQYWEEFEEEFAWDLLPYRFLFDLYKSWYDKNFPRSQQVSKQAFITSLSTLVNKESAIWEANEVKKKIRPGDKMSKPEPLIYDYQLNDWKSTVYNGRDKYKQSTLAPEELAANYSGLTRK